MPAYPAGSAARDAFVLASRPAKRPSDPWRSQGVIVEDERGPDGAVRATATVFLTGRECPWHCVMCDLWQGTTATDTPPGAIAAQVAAALTHLERASRQTAVIKLYNAGSFFDPRAVPDDDYDQVARDLAAQPALTRVIVESHPALVGRRTARLLETLTAAAEAAARSPIALEVAMGLETTHPQALESLNKRMTTADFERAAATLRELHVALRVFLLIAPPFVPVDEQDDWLMRSIDIALACGATAVSLIPTRPGPGALAALEATDRFRAPRLDDIERSLGLGLSRSRPPHARVFADTWDLERFSSCPACLPARRQRLTEMNHTQLPTAPPRCDACAAPC